MSNLIIPDADVVIDLLEAGVWEKVVNSHQVYLSRCVAADEVKYYKDDSGTVIVSRPVNLEADKRIEIIDIDAKDLLSLIEPLTPDEIQCFDDGERETLAIVKKQIIPGVKAVLTDEFAIRCAVFCRVDDSCISVETMLTDSGIKHSITNKLSESRYDRIVRSALAERIYRFNASG